MSPLLSGPPGADGLARSFRCLVQPCAASPAPAGYDACRHLERHRYPASPRTAKSVVRSMGRPVARRVSTALIAVSARNIQCLLCGRVRPRWAQKIGLFRIPKSLAGTPEATKSGATRDEKSRFSPKKFPLTFSMGLFGQRTAHRRLSDMARTRYQ